MPSVAFFRNLNQGQRTSPSSAALLAAFDDCGATGLAVYRSNGTVIFDADDPRRCAETVAGLLGARSPWSDVAFVRSADWIVGLANRLTARPPGALERTEVSFFDESISLNGLPVTGVRSTIVAGGPGYAITINDLPKTSQATPSIERLIAGPVTSRGVSTLIGLAGRLG
jgi:uncharacterized protein (DUF1697 family)